jgi:hypothetical protein
MCWITLDFEWEEQFKDLTLTMKRSDYWKLQCYATYQTDPIGIGMLDVLGEDNIMWAFQTRPDKK